MEDKRLVPSKYHIKYPLNSEREYIKLTNVVMHILKETLEANAGALKAAINDGTRYDSARDNQKQRQSERMSNFSRTSQQIESVFKQMWKQLTAKIGFISFVSSLVAISQQTERIAAFEFRKACKKTLGIEFSIEQFGGISDELFQKWIKENVELIKTIPFDALDDMKKMVFESYVKGNSTTAIMKQIQDRYGVSKRRARVIARDQIGKLNSEVTKFQQEKAGCKYYQWDTSGDKRVRKEHQELDGKIFSWDDSHPARDKKGNIIYPGLPICCRCVSLPVFDLDNIPWEIPKEKESQKLS